MRKILLAGAMLTGIFIVVLASIFILIDPDKLKPVITTQVEKYTGFQLIIEDHLALAFFPYLAVKVNHIQVMTPDELDIPAMKVDVKNAVVRLKLISLLRGKFESGAVQIDQLTLDQQAIASTIQLNKILLESADYNQSTHSFLAKLSFDYSENSLALSGHAAIAGDVAINDKLDACVIKNVSTRISVSHHEQTLQLTATGDLTLDTAHQTAALKKFKAVLSNLTINGEVNAKNILSDPSVSGYFTLQSSHLQKVLDQTGLFKKELIHLIDLDQSTAKLELFAGNGSFNIHSNVRITDAKIANANIENLAFRIHFNNNMLNIESIKASLFGGYVNGEAAIHLQSPLPVMTGHFRTFNIQIEPLFRLMQAVNADIRPMTTLSGTGDIELDVSTTGEDETGILNNLKGKSYLRITKGTFAGRDWDEIAARLFAADQAREALGLRAFRFQQLTASFSINNGILSCVDLLLTTPEVNIKGKGNINLPGNVFDYELQAEWQNPQASTNPVSFSGILM